jgi:hypothetical protein
MSIIINADITCDHQGCQVVSQARVELHESRIMDGALGEHMLTSMSVLDSPDLKGWKTDTTGQGKCRCPLHNKLAPIQYPPDPKWDATEQW